MDLSTQDTRTAASSPRDPGISGATRGEEPDLGPQTHPRRTDRTRLPHRTRHGVAHPAPCRHPSRPTQSRRLLDHLPTRPSLQRARQRFLHSRHRAISTATGRIVPGSATARSPSPDDRPPRRHRPPDPTPRADPRCGRGWCYGRERRRRERPGAGQFPALLYRPGMDVVWVTSWAFGATRHSTICMPSPGSGPVIPRSLGGRGRSGCRSRDVDGVGCGAALRRVGEVHDVCFRLVEDGAEDGAESDVWWFVRP